METNTPGEFQRAIHHCMLDDKRAAQKKQWLPRIEWSTDGVSHQIAAFNLGNLDQVAVDAETAPALNEMDGRFKWKFGRVHQVWM